MRLQRLLHCMALLAGSLLVSSAHAQTCPVTAPAISNATLAAACADGSGAASASPACTLYRLCFTSSLRPRPYANVCSLSRISATLCLDDTAIVSKLPGCSSYASQKTAILSNPTCKQQLGYFSIFSTPNTKQGAGLNCAAMGGADGMPGCDLCPNTSNCTDPLLALGQGCADMKMAGCSKKPDGSGVDWTAFCTQDAAGPNGEFGIAAARLCFTPDKAATVPEDPASSATPQPPTPAPAPTPGGATVDPCVSNPSASSCASYVYPTASIQKDIDSLCTAMPDMPGCSVQSACQANQVSNQQWCAPFTLLASMCMDMPTMLGCSSYRSMCAAGSVVPQCAAAGKGIPNLPSWAQTRQAIFSLCQSHYMDACAACSPTGACPSPLNLLVEACAEMPTMPECTNTIEPFCGAIASSGGGLTPFCNNDGSAHTETGNPSMLMYFHERFAEFVLWKGWIPRNRGQYTGTIICVLSFGVVSMGLKTWATCLGLTWRAPSQAAFTAAARQGPYSFLLPHGSQYMHNTAKAFISAIAICLDYFNMLIAMTFNVGLFVAVVLGYALGALLFSHIPENYAAMLGQQRRRSEEEFHARLNPPAAATIPSAVVSKLADNGSTTDSEQGRVKASIAVAEGFDCELNNDPPSCCPGPC